MSPKRYSVGVVAVTLGLVAAAWILAWWLEPLHGDLTRIGGYAEREFGWNEPMEEFHPPLATWGNSYDQPADVLVIGDSFANGRWPGQQWQNWLAARTGWRIHTLDKHKIRVDELVASETYKEAPPPVVIWNNVERDLKNEYAVDGKDCELPPASAGRAPLRRAEVQVRTVHRYRAKSISKANPGFARVWLWKRLLREASADHSDVLLLRLSRADLFSSRFSSGLLVFRKDLRKALWRNADLPRIRCGYADMAKRIEANGITRFVTAIAPDKSSAYRRWLVAPNQLPPSLLVALLDDFPVPDARLDWVLAAAIEAGTPDVYMPDDTHWGSAGQRLAADAILRLFVNEGLAE